jgi:uncharacterized membrane protein
VSWAAAFHTVQFSKIAIKQINLGNAFAMLVLFDLFTVASLRSESLGAGRHSSGSYSPSIAFARPTSFFLPRAVQPDE